MPEWLSNLLSSVEDFIASLSSNIKLVDKALMGLEGSYVELLTILALGLLAVIPLIVPRKRRQFYRRLNQIFGICIFVFVVFTCLGVFGMIRNLFRGLSEIGRENIVALYYCSVPATIIVTSMIFGPMFCGWICPTGALQEFTGMLTGKWNRRRKREGWRFSRGMLVLVLLVCGVFIAWMAYLSANRVFFVEDASIYWSEVLLIICLLLLWRMKAWDKRLRRLRILSFFIIVAAAIAGMQITSPVHFGFSKVYDPASLLSTVMVGLAALAIPQVWCRYLCPWREAISFASRCSTRKLETDFDKCIECGKCTDVCNVEAVKDGHIDPKECHMCLKCVDICPVDAIELKENWKGKGCGT
ncbi:MAG: 4Fe-4S binding protein [Planctomycetota bacterium]|nr:4Fe-4S binding protein [Planctomycetota bacterium]